MPQPIPPPSSGMITRLAEALALHRAGDRAAAEALYRTVIAAAPQLAQAHYLLGLLLLESGRAADALAVLRQAVLLRPGDPDTGLALARACAECGEVPEAIALLRTVQQERPRDIAILLALAQLLARTGDIRAALGAGRQAVGLAPDSTQARAALACHLVQAGQPEAALVEAEAGLARQPQLAEGWLARGIALRALGHAAEAMSALERAAELAPDAASVLLAMANARADCGDTATAAELLRQAILRAPQLAEAHASLGAVLTAEGRLPEAIAACNGAIAVDPRFAPGWWNRAVARLLAGDLEGGFEDAEWRKRHPRFAADFAALSGPEWTGEALAGRHLLVHAGQGMGDTIQFARYLPALVGMGARVTLACAEALVPLLSRIEGVAVVARAEGLPAHDLWVDQMSLPHLLGVETVPLPQGYLTADPARVAAWRREIGMGMRIGLVWAGNPAHSNDRNRSLPPSMAARLLRPVQRIVASSPRLRLVGLQAGARHGELAPLGVLDVSAGLTDFAETAALVSALDLVVTVDTAVAHLAGALGRPAWVMLPHAPDWRWQLARGDSPWYASVRLFRQPAPGDWDSVARAVAAALRVRYAPRDSQLAASMPPVAADAVSAAPQAMSISESETGQPLSVAKLVRS
jgi:tetratricopeptide (TPR) repeat protein